MLCLVILSKSDSFVNHNRNRSIEKLKDLRNFPIFCQHTLCYISLQIQFYICCKPQNFKVNDPIIPNRIIFKEDTNVTMTS